MPTSPRPPKRSNTRALLGVLGLAVAVFAFQPGQDRAPPTLSCGENDPGCPASSPGLAASEVTPAAAPSFRADSFCVNVGYLCAGLVDGDVIRLHRWRDFAGTMVVHVPLPPAEDPSLARELQRAAAQGIRAWNNQPFPVLADLHGDRNPHFAIRWRPTLGGMQLGIAHTEWSSANGLRVIEIELAASPPSTSPAGLTRQIQLTAAHEMGHALGLAHSDSPRDVMYSTNTATMVSARDRRSMEVLYATPDGTVVAR